MNWTLWSREDAQWALFILRFLHNNREGLFIPDPIVGVARQLDHEKLVREGASRRGFFIISAKGIEEIPKLAQIVPGW